MLYIFNIVFGCFYLQFCRVEKWSDLWKVFPVVLIWTLIAGAQVRVGVDYPQYLRYFSHPYHWHVEFEPLFASATETLFEHGIKGQAFFFVYAFITACFIFAGAYAARIKNWGTFYLLLITVSTIFNGQMNGLRQCVAVSVAFWGTMEMYSRRKLGLLLVFISGFIHTSSFACILFYWIVPVTNITQRYSKTLLILAAASCFVTSGGVLLNNFLLGIVPSSMMENTHYMIYADSDMGRSGKLIYRMSKAVLMPMYWWALSIRKDDILDRHQQRLFDLGILSYFMRNVLMVNQLLGRMSYYFWIPSIFPIYYLASYYWSKANYTKFAIVVLFSSSIYFFKVIVQSEGYAHRFLYFM